MSIQVKPRFCPHCDSRRIIKKGTRKNQHRLVQIYFCKSCFRYFTTADIQKTKYPPYVIMRSISLYHLGYSQAEVSRLIRIRHRLDIPQRTISQWITKYRPICSYSRLRDSSRQLFLPQEIIKSQLLDHCQLYTFKIHRAKLALLAARLLPSAREHLHEYLHSVFGEQFPHYYFRSGDTSGAQSKNGQLSRSSATVIATLPFVQSEKQNQANDLAALGLVLAKRPRDRHASIQDFMLANDAATIACEVPVYLTLADINYFRRQGFAIALPDQSLPITGHIDFLQIRNGLIRILDYKPNAHRITPVSQLTLYALGLASRTKLPLKIFQCAWFDEKNYYEFFPLHAVYPKSSNNK